VFIIAEAGVNHNGDPAVAKRLIDAAADAGASAVKFQTFRAEQLVRRDAPKAAYQTRTTPSDESQFDMLRQLELSEEQHLDLAEHASRRGLTMLSTPFDLASLRFLVDRCRLTTIKIGSGDVTNEPLLLATARAAHQVILSTGMCTLAEVESALCVLAFGFSDRVSERPARSDFLRAYSSSAGLAALRARVTLLHCTTEYPAPFDEVNLRAMDSMADAFHLPVGYSDHTAGFHVSLAAVARGAKLIEKHFTLDRNMPGPDHAASIEPDDLTALVRQIRQVECALGDGVKRPTVSEWKNRDVARKSLVAARDIAAGEEFSAANLTCKRPGNGAPPSAYWPHIGRHATRSYAADELIDE